MKTTIIVTITLIMTTITSFTLYNTEPDTKYSVGQQIVSALQHRSVSEYTALFPKLSDFHVLMMKNAELYGTNLSEAAREFEKEYDGHLYPEFEKSFERILREGHAQGIDWRTIRLISVEIPEPGETDFAAVPMTVRFNAKGVNYRLKVDKVLIIDGKWKVSQHINLEKE